MHNDVIINLKDVNCGQFRFVTMGKNNEEELLIYAYDYNDTRKYIAIAKLTKNLTVPEKLASITRLEALMKSYSVTRELGKEYSEYDLTGLLDSPVGKNAEFTKEGYDLLNHKHLFSDGKLARTVYVYIDPEKYNHYGSLEPSNEELFKPFKSYNDLDLTPFEARYTDLKEYLNYHFKKIIDFCYSDKREKDVQSKISGQPLKSDFYEMLMNYSTKAGSSKIKSAADYYNKKESAQIKERLIEEVLKVIDAQYERKISKVLSNQKEVTDETMSMKF